MKLNLESLSSAIDSLSRSLVAVEDAVRLGLSSDICESIQSGVIQNFEVAYEQAWKMMKRWIQENIGSSEVDGVTRRELFRVAMENLLIQDIDAWMMFHHARNETSHTYNGIIAKSVFKTAKSFLNEAKKLRSVLLERND